MSVCMGVGGSVGECKENGVNSVNSMGLLRLTQAHGEVVCNVCLIYKLLFYL